MSRVDLTTSAVRKAFGSIPVSPTKEYGDKMDKIDPLKRFRYEFNIPMASNNCTRKEAIYFGALGLGLPPKREPIKILPFERIDIDFDFLNKQMEIANTVSLKSEDDGQYDDIKQTDDENDGYTDDEKKDEYEDTDIDSPMTEEDTEDEIIDQAMINMMEQEKVKK